MTDVQNSPAPNPAEMYEQVLVTQLFGPLASELMKVAPPSPEDRVLDIACGTGIVLRQVALNGPQPKQMAGIDINPAMINVARMICQDDGVDSELQEASVDDLPFPDGAFTLAYCQQRLQFFPDKVGALAEVNRVLDDSGRLVSLTWRGLEHHPYIRDLNDVAQKHAGIEMLNDPFSLGDEHQLEGLARQAGFRDVEIQQISETSTTDEPERNARIMLMGATAAIRALQSLDAEERAALVDSVVTNASDVFEQYSKNGTLSTDWHTNVLIAVK